MASNEQQGSGNDFFYRPHITPPERDFTTHGSPVDKESFYVRKEDIPDPYAAWIPIFEEYRRKAILLKRRAQQLMDISVADIGGYVGDAPQYILTYITDLTGIVFPTDEEDPNHTSPVFTLPFIIKKCIFRIAGFYDSNSDKLLADNVAEFEVGAVEEQMKNTLSGKRYLGKHGLLMYGIKLLVIVLKLCYVILVYYTVGYLCGFFKGKLVFGYSKKIAGKTIGFTFRIGDKIASYFNSVEKTLLSIVGFGCKTNPATTPVECPTSVDPRDLESQFSFRKIECCTTKPLFFDNRSFYPQKFDFSHCLKAMVEAELDPLGYIQGPVCSYENAENGDIEISPENQTKAKVVADYLVSQSVSRYGINGYQNVGPLNNAINAADSAEFMSQQVSSMLNENSYQYTNFIAGKGPFDCFGYSSTDTTSSEEDIINAINANSGRWLKEGGDPPIAITSAATPPFEFIGDFIKSLDTGVGQLIDIADRVVSGTANLTLWGSSRQLCCWVYLLVFASTMIRRLVQTNGKFCSDKMVKCYNCGGDGVVEGNSSCPVCLGTGQIQDSQAFAHDLRHEMGAMWATEIKQSAEVQQFVAILKVIKAIVDAYIQSLNRPILLQGLRLPLQEMWELIKITIANGLSQFVDVLFYPIDVVLSGFQGIPEIRLALANECFGIDRLFDFLVCNLNNLKFSLVNAVMRLIDFTVNDVTLINDIYLARTRLATLEALSRLLDRLIRLILGLKDCYNPGELADEIVDKQISEQYQQIRDVEDLLSESGVSFDELYRMRESLNENEFPVSPAERSALDSMSSTLSSRFGSLSGIAEEIVMQSLKSFDSIVIGNAAPTSMHEFAQLLERSTGTSVAEVKESIAHIFDILRGA